MGFSIYRAVLECCWVTNICKSVFWEMFLGQFTYNVVRDIDSVLLALKAPSFQKIIRTLLLTLNKQTVSYFSSKKWSYLGSARNCYLRSATLESPHRSRKEYFYRGQEGRQSAWLFIDWVLARKEEESSCWPLIITGYKSSPC